MPPFLKDYNGAFMRLFTLPVLFILFLIPGCVKEQVTYSEVSVGEITEAPELNISVGIETGERTLTWTRVNNATLYIVQRDLSYNFSSPELFYSGSGFSKNLSPSPDGQIRYYRVMAQNQKYPGPWSEIIND